MFSNEAETFMIMPLGIATWLHHVSVVGIATGRYEICIVNRPFLPSEIGEIRV